MLQVAIELSAFLRLCSVDLETDSKIQETILREFKHKTLLCIAHRLRTIINYERVLVMDQGLVAVRNPGFAHATKTDVVFLSRHLGI